jgi:hypothetical protein
MVQSLNFIYPMPYVVLELQTSGQAILHLSACINPLVTVTPAPPCTLQEKERIEPESHVTLRDAFPCARNLQIDWQKASNFQCLRNTRNVQYQTKHYQHP